MSSLGPAAPRMKAVLFTLLKAFKFQLGVPASEIEADRRYDVCPLTYAICVERCGLCRMPIGIRPTLKSQPELGWQMPVTVSHVQN